MGAAVSGFGSVNKDSEEVWAFREKNRDRPKRDAGIVQGVEPSTAREADENAFSLLRDAEMSDHVGGFV
jgi:hypothetical protein